MFGCVFQNPFGRILVNFVVTRHLCFLNSISPNIVIAAGTKKMPAKSLKLPFNFSLLHWLSVQ